MASSSRHKTCYDTRLKEVIIHAKFDVCTPGSFRGIKTDIQSDTQTELRFIYLISTSHGRVAISNVGIDNVGLAGFTPWMLG